MIYWCTSALVVAELVSPLLPAVLQRGLFVLDDDGLDGELELDGQSSDMCILSLAKTMAQAESVEGWQHFRIVL